MWYERCLRSIFPPICAGHNAAPVRDYGTKERCEMTLSNSGEGSLRSVGGPTNNTGVLQVYLSGRWGGICANGIQYDSDVSTTWIQELAFNWVSDCIKYYIGHIILFVKQMIVY